MFLYLVTGTCCITDERLRRVAINQCCLVCYTSGATGASRGAMFSHDNLTWTAKMIQGFIRSPGFNRSLWTMAPANKLFIARPQRDRGTDSGNVFQNIQLFPSFLHLLTRSV